MKKISINILFYFFVCFYTLAQDGLQITLRVDYEIQKKVFQNEPVIFSVSVINKAAQSDNLWNISANRRISEINELVKDGKLKQEDADLEKQEIEKNKRSSPSIQIGNAANPWTSQLKWEITNKQTNKTITFPIQLMSNPLSSSMVNLESGKTASAYFGLSHESMGSISPGSYLIALKFNNVSDQVQLEIEKEKLNEATMPEEALLKYGLFYWHAGDSKKTLHYADLILKKNPASVDGLSLKGDAQVIGGSYLPALETFNEAVKQYYKLYGNTAEPPEYLISMIGMVKEKLGDYKN